MNADAERSRSYWARTATVDGAAPLNHDREVEVVVIGAGIAGLSTAYELARAGRSVAVLDRGAIAGGMSARTTAHLASELDDYYHELINLRGLDEARLYYESQAAALDRIESISREESIDCDFRRIDGYLFSPPGSGAEVLEREFEGARQVRFSGVEWVDRAPIPGVNTGRCLRFPRQARFHPLKYLDGLVRCIRRYGGSLFGSTPATEVYERGEEVVVETATGYTVRAAAGVVATNSPINDRIAIHTKQAPYRTYVIAGSLPHGAVADALYWDTLDPYHYVRLQPDQEGGEDTLIVGGEDHKTGHASDMEQRFARLEAWAREHFPQLQAITDRWSGQVIEPVDYVPFVGRNHGNSRIFVTTGDSGEGLSNSVAASILLRDLILGQENRWADVFDPKRVTLRAAGEFARENIDVAARLAENVTSGDISSVDDLRPGQGAIVRRGLGKVAAYRDESGDLHVRSAVCTHAGCIVHWNPLERCWDCPCHGSHFAIDGTVLNGPATRPLSQVEETAPEQAPTSVEAAK